MAPLTKTCSRCGGSGQYSFNPIDGSICYGCQGKGDVLAAPAKQGVKITAEALYAEAGDVVEIRGAGMCRVLEVQIGGFTRKERDVFGDFEDRTYAERLRLKSLIDDKIYVYLRSAPVYERIDSSGRRMRINKKTMLWSEVK